MKYYLPLVKSILNYAVARPVFCALILAVLSNAYLIYDYSVVNRSSLHMLWSLAEGQGANSSPLSQLIDVLARATGLNYVDAGHLLMIFSYSSIAVLLLLIARLLGYGLVSQWALIFLLLSHPSFNDFRSYIIVEPLFWLLLIFAIYCMLRFYKSHPIVCIFLWLSVLFVATKISVAAWFWLFLFPFASLFWRPWRRKSVMYALCGYALIVGVLLFLPLYEGVSPFSWFRESILSNPDSLSMVLRLKDNNWVKEGDTLMFGIFILSGATSLIIVRVSISLSVACLFLAVYAVVKKRHHVLNRDYLRILFSAIVFDFMITIVLLLLSADSGSVLSFSVCFLLLLFSALGLSYVFKKMYGGRYSRLQVLVIVWCLVAYFASGFIIFGPRQGYLKEAGLSFRERALQTSVYSDDSYFLFYAEKNPQRTVSLQEAIELGKSESFYFAHAQSRKVSLPEVLQSKTLVKSYANARGDRLMIYWFGSDALNSTPTL